MEKIEQEQALERQQAFIADLKAVLDKHGVRIRLTEQYGGDEQFLGQEVTFVNYNADLDSEARYRLYLSIEDVVALVEADEREEAQRQGQIRIAVQSSTSEIDLGV